MGGMYKIPTPIFQMSVREIENSCLFYPIVIRLSTARHPVIPSVNHCKRPTPRHPHVKRTSSASQLSQNLNKKKSL